MPGTESKPGQPGKKLKPAAVKPDKAAVASLDALAPDKLVLFLDRLQAEKTAREDKLIAEGKAVRLIATRFEGESIEDGRERALACHGPLHDVTAVFADYLILFEGGPMPYRGSDPTILYERPAPDLPTSNAPDNNRQPQHRSVPSGRKLERVLVEHDGSVHEDWFYLTADNVIQLCNVAGTPYREDDLKHRISASTDDPDRIAKILLRRKVMGRPSDFGRPLPAATAAGWVPMRSYNGLTDSDE